MRYEFDAIPHEQAPMAADSFLNHLALLGLCGLIDRRRQGKNNFHHLTDTDERLSDIVKGMIR